MKQHIIIAAIFVAFFVFPVTHAHAQTEPPVVRAVLFYSPTCGHCEYVINNTLLPLIEKYGEQLQIIGINVTQEQGQALFLSAMQMFNLEQAGVPFLVIDDMYLIGSLDIPEKFPGLVDDYLAQGGVDWPEVPGLMEALALDVETATALPPTQSATLQSPPVPVTASPTFVSPTATPAFILNDHESSNWLDTFANDPAGNTLSVIVLIGMSASVITAFILFQKTNDHSPQGTRALLVPVLCALGFGIAGYLAYVETTQTTAICGPVGDCNTVQQSDYARLFGLLPIGILGLFGYAVIFISWLIARYANERLADLATLSIFFMTFIGTLFSIYLTFLEPFVIGASCAWCLTSAILMTTLMLLTIGPAKLAMSRNPFPRSRS